jgi:hypothetical protein
MRRNFAAFLFAAAALVTGGCVAAVVVVGAAGTVAYVKGDLEAIVAKDLTAVYNACLKALPQLQITPTKTEKDVISAKIVGRGTDDEKITIKLRRTAADSTRLSIRVGFFGDETLSMLIYDRIKQNLR